MTYSSAGVGHVVDENGDLVLDVTDEDHATNDVGSGALLVNQSKGRVEAIGNRGGTLGTTSIRRHDDAVLNVQVLADPAKHRGLGVKVVDGHVEEALDLRCVEVHGDDVVLLKCG